MIRAACISILLAGPAAAWEFTPGLPCVLTHDASDVAVELTYDPRVPVYTFALKRAEGFEPALVFGLQFIGDMPILISTDQHQFSADGKTLSVTDSGFGNVLNGLQFNATSVARLGDLTLDISLTGAAAPVAAFRACEATAPTS